MKIDGTSPNNPNLDRVTTSRTDAARQYAGASAQTPPGAAEADSVQLSPEAQLAERVRQAASNGDVMRQDLILEARQRLDAGQVGADPMALADRLIDAMFGN